VNRRSLPSTLVTAFVASMVLAACGSSSPTSPDATAPVQATTTTPPSTDTHTVTRTAGTYNKPARTPASKPTAPTTARRVPGAHRPVSPRIRVAIAQFRTCMRQNGVNIPEPGAKPGSQPRTASSTPQFKAAAAKCRGPLITALKRKPAAPGHVSVNERELLPTG
jgi:hypothetical protein